MRPEVNTGAFGAQQPWAAPRCLLLLVGKVLMLQLCSGKGREELPSLGRKDKSTFERRANVLG